MLYNKNWETKEDKSILTLESLIAWLEQQPRSCHYNFSNCTGGCLYGRYMAAHGIDWDNSGATGSHSSTAERSVFCWLVYDKVAMQKPWTYSAALKRARKVAALEVACLAR